ncbi:hypothetical protein LSH36_16g11048, partial [Paralvinella palmiformis]
MLQDSAIFDSQRHYLSSHFVFIQRPIRKENSVIIYNRVPKSGSSALIKIIDQMAQKHNFTLISSSIYTTYRINETEQEHLVRSIERMRKPLVYERHVHYIQFSKRYQEGHIRKMPLLDRIRSYDECVLGNYSECTSPKGSSSEEGYFKLIPFFCGQEAFCSSSVCQPPIYINLISDPIQRLTSWYYFRRHHKYQEGHNRKIPLLDRIR